MARISVVGPGQAEGELRDQYDKAIGRAGRIWNVVSIMSQNPATMKASMELYKAIMYGRSSLSRAQREILATVVSVSNHCVY